MTDKVETSLHVDLFLIRRRVGRVLGHPEDEADWTQAQMRAATECIRDGLRMVYSPPEVDEYGSHQWSFLYPTVTMKTVADQRWYPMPDGFTGELKAAGGITYTGDNRNYTPIKVTNSAYLRRLENIEPDSTGYPRYAAVKTSSDRGITPQTWELGLHPTPDGEYDLAYECCMEPYMLTEERPYPLGGQEHGQMILLGCLAAAELYEFDQAGEHMNRFIMQLKADIRKDCRKGPATLGYGGVHRRGGSTDLVRRHDSNQVVTYNNQTWGD